MEAELVELKQSIKELKEKIEKIEGLHEGHPARARLPELDKQMAELERQKTLEQEMKFLQAQAAATAQAGGSLAGKPVLITFNKGTVERTVTFTHMPSWLELCQRVEEVFTELQAEAFSLQIGKLELSEPLWPGSVESTVIAKKTTMTLQVKSKCKAFSSFKMSETWHVLDTATQNSEEDALQFPMAEYEVDAALDAQLKACLGEKYGDIITLAGQELALRCLKTDPKKRNKEACKRELISPVIYAAAALAGDDVTVDAEHNVTGTLGKGNIDYTIQYDGFSIVVLESKVHATMEEHLGQLAAEMRAAREHYQRVYLGKRKYDDEGEFKKVPSFGILSNGTTYILYKYTPEDKHLKQFTARISLDKGIKAEAASEAVLPILRRLVHMIKEQMECMKSFKKAKL